MVLCRWVQSLHGQKDVQLSFSDQRLSISQSRAVRISIGTPKEKAAESPEPCWVGQLRLWRQYLSVCFILAYELCACAADTDPVACKFNTCRMRLLGGNQPAAPAWLHLWWMIHPQSLQWGRKVSQELFPHGCGSSGASSAKAVIHEF